LRSGNFGRMFAGLTNKNREKPMKTIPEQNREIQQLLRIIAQKCKNFAEEHANTYYGDLGAVKQDLMNVNNFLSDKYLNEPNR